MHANRLTLIQRVFGRGQKVQSILAFYITFYNLFHQSALCDILGQAFIHDIRPGPVLFVYAVAFTLVVHHH